MRKIIIKMVMRKGLSAVCEGEEVREGSMRRCNERNKKSNVGIKSYMSAVFGIAVASVVLRGLIGEYN